MKSCRSKASLQAMTSFYHALFRLAPEGPNPEKEDRVMLTRHRVSRILYLHKFFDYPISIKWQTFHNMGFGRTMKAGFGYLGSAFINAKKNPWRISISTGSASRFTRCSSKTTPKRFGEEIRAQISPDWGSQRVKGLSLWKAFTNVITKPFKKNSKHVETSLIEQFEYPKKGPGSLYEQMADLVEEMGGEIRLENEVVGLSLENNEVTAVQVKTPKGLVTLHGDYVVSSMPLKDLYAAFGEKNVPEDAYQVATHLVYRDFITVGLLVNKLKIKNTTKIKTVNNLVPDTWIYIQEREVKLGRLQLFNNWSPYMVKDPEHTVWLGLEYFASEGDAALDDGKRRLYQDGHRRTCQHRCHRRERCFGCDGNQSQKSLSGLFRYLQRYQDRPRPP
jgi:hypothetical protein